MSVNEVKVLESATGGNTVEEQTKYVIEMLREQLSLLEQGKVPLGLALFVVKTTIETPQGKVAATTAEAVMVAEGDHQQAVCEVMRTMAQRNANAMDLAVNQLVAARGRSKNVH